MEIVLKLLRKFMNIRLLINVYVNFSKIPVNPDTQVYLFLGLH